MAYSPFDMASLPELGGADSINLEEELKKIGEITGLEDVELNSRTGTPLAKGSIDKSTSAEDSVLEETAHHSSESNDAILELSLDSIIQRVESQTSEQHITIEHAIDGSTLVVQQHQQGRKRAHDAAQDDDGGAGGDDGAEETATKRRRLDTASEQTSATGEESASEAPAAAAVAGEAGAGSAAVATEELELSWSWGDDGEEVMDDDGASTVDPPKRVSALLAEVAKVEDVELKGEEEEKLAKELNGNLNRENPFELPIIIRQRRVARLRKRAEVHQRKIKQILTTWDVTPPKRP